MCPTPFVPRRPLLDPTHHTTNQSSPKAGTTASQRKSDGFGKAHREVVSIDLGPTVVRKHSKNETWGQRFRNPLHNLADAGVIVALSFLLASSSAFPFLMHNRLTPTHHIHTDRPARAIARSVRPPPQAGIGVDDRPWPACCRCLGFPFIGYRAARRAITACCLTTSSSSTGR